jgi:hypothetical protein
MAPLPRTRRLALVLLFATLMTANGMAGAKEPTPLQNGAGCLHDEPDSVQISWEAPCQDGSWLMDTELGCRMWDWHNAALCVVGEVAWFQPVHQSPLESHASHALREIAMATTLLPCLKQPRFHWPTNTSPAICAVPEPCGRLSS